MSSVGVAVSTSTAVRNKRRGCQLVKESPSKDQLNKSTSRPLEQNGPLAHSTMGILRDQAFTMLANYTSDRQGSPARRQRSSTSTRRQKPPPIDPYYQNMSYQPPSCGEAQVHENHLQAPNISPLPFHAQSTSLSPLLFSSLAPPGSRATSEQKMERQHLMSTDQYATFQQNVSSQQRLDLRKNGSRFMSLINGGPVSSNILAQKQNIFTRTVAPSSERASYTKFAPTYLVAQGKGTIDEGFPMQLPPFLPSTDRLQMHPFLTHDILETEWQCFLLDIHSVATLSMTESLGAKGLSHAAGSVMSGGAYGVIVIKSHFSNGSLTT